MKIQSMEKCDLFRVSNLAAHSGLLFGVRELLKTRLHALRLAMVFECWGEEIFLTV